jgi:hypothetical protein
VTEKTSRYSEYTKTGLIFQTNAIYIFLFVIHFLVHLLFLSSFLARSFFIPIPVLVSIVRSIIQCFSHILPTFLLHTSFVILCFRLSSSVSLHSHRMCCTVSITSAQSDYRHLIAPFRLLSVIFHHSPPLHTFFIRCSPFPSYSIRLSPLVGTFCHS